MAIEYILVCVDFDENRSEVVSIKDEDFLSLYFDKEEKYLKPLLETGRYCGEWGNYHLIKLGDYK